MRALKATGFVKPPRGFFANAFLPPHVPPSEWPWTRSGGLEVAQQQSREEWKKGVREWGTPEALLADEKAVDQLIPVMRADLMLFDLYEYHGEPANPEKLPCPVYATCAAADPMITKAMMERWAEVAGEGKFLLTEYAKGDHLFINDEGLRNEWMAALLTIARVELELGV